MEQLFGIKKCICSTYINITNIINEILKRDF